MGYQITYDRCCGRKVLIEKKEAGKRKRVVSIVIIVLAVVFSIIARNSEMKYILLPGDGVVTYKAIDNFISSMKSGLQLGDAVTVFCQEIIDGAN